MQIVCGDKKMTAFETEEFEIEETLDEQSIREEMPTFNHSNICAEIIGQIWSDQRFKPLPELTLDIDSGITPDVCVYPREKINPNYARDVTRYYEMPIVAIEVISPSQNIQNLLEKAETLVNNGVKAVWTIEPFTNSIVVTTKDGFKRFQNQEIESEGVKVDFRRIFGDG